jgi:hypothetical protein
MRRLMWKVIVGTREREPSVVMDPAAVRNRIRSPMLEICRQINSKTILGVPKREFELRRNETSVSLDALIFLWRALS